MNLYVAVIGPGDTDPEVFAMAEEVGRRLASAGVIVLTGGLGGVMEAACRGAVSMGGTTVGLLPGDDRSAANPSVRVAIATGIGEGRNLLLVQAADAVVSIGGGWGTLSEIALAQKLGKTVIMLHGWDIVDQVGAPVTSGIIRVETPQDAASEALLAAW